MVNWIAGKTDAKGEWGNAQQLCPGYAGNFAVQFVADALTLSGACIGQKNDELLASPAEDVV